VEAFTLAIFPVEITVLPLISPYLLVATRRKVVRHAKKKRARKSPRSTPPMPSLSAMRLKR